MNRRSGILLHPVSLPNDEGIGTLGDEAFAFIDWLKKNKLSIWQMLPIGPTGYGDSPYASFSAFAGNPYLISLTELHRNRLLSNEAFYAYKKIIAEHTEKNKVHYGIISSYKTAVLKIAAQNILLNSDSDSLLKERLEKFYTEEKFWLDDFALFMTVKEFYDKKNSKKNVPAGIWNNCWGKEIALYKKKAIEYFSAKFSVKVQLHKIIQFLFYEQWENIKRYAEEKNIQLIGDIPIFVAPDSADVWAHQKLFMLDEDGKPAAVAGVPPDYFSAEGQLWGNPLYDWKEMKNCGYVWWKMRIRHMLKLFDIIRIDHFRGFESFWAIPPKACNAVSGTWLQGPAHSFFTEIKNDLINLNSKYASSLPIIAEDLGIITDSVVRLRDDFNFPGMKVLQFAFDVNEIRNGKLLNHYLPHNIPKNCVAYTGTHDNDTLIGWLDDLSDEQLGLVYSYITGKPFTKNEYEIYKTAYGKRELSAEIIRLCLASPADSAIIPMQDILFEGKEARMNTPNTCGSNWQWRMETVPSENEITEKLSLWNMLYGRG